MAVPDDGEGSAVGLAVADRRSAAEAGRMASDSAATVRLARHCQGVPPPMEEVAAANRGEGGGT